MGEGESPSTSVREISERRGISKKFYTSSALSFTIPLILGIVIGYYYPDIGSAALEMAYGDMSYIGQLGKFELFIFIALRNSFIGLVLVLSGIAIGIPTLLILIGNGFTIGVILGWIVKDFGISVVLLGVVPHGLLEIPAVLLCGAYGLYVGANVAGRLRGRRDITLKDKLKESLGTYIKVALPMFITAAAIEAYVTPYFLRGAIE